MHAGHADHCRPVPSPLQPGPDCSLCLSGKLCLIRVVVWWIAPRPRISVLVTRAGLGARSFGWSTLVVDMLAPREGDG
jgi:hypothetical protein